MAITKSAKKAIKTEKTKKAQNDITRAKVKDALKGARLAINGEAKEKEVLEKLAKAYRELDIAAKKNVIHKNKASRLKSRLAKSIKS